MKSAFLIIVLASIAPVHARAAGSRAEPGSPDLVTITLRTAATPSPAPISVRARRFVVGEGRNGTFCISLDVTCRNPNPHSIWSRGFSESAACCWLENWSEEDADWKRIGFVYKPEGLREIEAGAEQSFQLCFSECEFGPDTKVVFEYFDDPEFESSNRIEALMPQLQEYDDPADEVTR